MEELGKEVLAALFGKSESSILAWMLIMCGYLAWQNYTAKKEHREELKEYKEALERLQLSLSQKTGEEREMLLSIIEKYHQSQIGIREAIHEVKSVLTTIAALGNRGM